MQELFVQQNTNLLEYKKKKEIFRYFLQLYTAKNSPATLPCVPFSCRYQEDWRQSCWYGQTSFQIWLTLAGHEEVDMRFKPIRSGEI